MTFHGYAGSILYVDLTSKTIKKKPNTKKKKQSKVLLKRILTAVILIPLVIVLLYYLLLIGLSRWQNHLTLLLENLRYSDSEAWPEYYILADKRFPIVGE